MNEASRSVKRVMIDGRVLIEPSGGVFEYARQVTRHLKASPALRTEVWANAGAGKATEGIDARTRLPNVLLNAAVRIFRAPKLDRIAKMRPEAAWMPNPNFAAFSPQVRLALTIHDLTFETYPEFFSLKQRLWHRAVNPRALAARADALLAVSETTKRDITERWRIPPERITVAHAGVAPSFFETIPQEELEGLRQRLHLPERFVLQIGTLEPRKNHLGVLEAYRQLRAQPRFRDLGLVLAGPAGWENAPILKAIQQSPHRGDIRHLGYVSDAERRCLYRLAAVLAFPSFYEGFGLPPLEAMASGTPVVASHAGALGEVVADAGLLTDPYRPSEIASGLEAVLDSPTLAVLYRERGLIRAKRFSWEACAQKTEEALLRILS